MNLIDNWSIRKIQDLAEIEPGGTPSTSVSEYWNGDYLWATPTDITGTSGKYISDTSRKISKSGLAHASKILPKGSILLCTRATIGEARINTVPITTNQGFKNLVPKAQVCNEWLFYALQTRIEEMRSLSSGSTFLELGTKQLGNIEIYTPEFHEQKIIAKALSEVDELIETLKLEILKYRNLQSAVIQKLFPSNYLSGQLPNGWERKSLGEIGTISGAGVDKMSRSGDIPIKLLNYMDVYRNTFITPDIDFMDTTATKDQLRHRSLLKGDVLFTPTSETPDDIARSSVVLDNLANTCYSYHLIRFRPNFNLDLKYLAYVFFLEDFRQQALRAAEGSGTRYVITLPRFRSLVIPLPDLKTQNEIGKVVNDIENQIETLLLQLVKYQEIKSGMAHDLLTGKVRLV